MKEEIITVDDLTVRVVTGETCYPNEDGFSSISAEVMPIQEELVTKLTKLKEMKKSVTLRCAMLDVSGRITNILSDAENKRFIMVVEGMEYRQPSDLESR